MNCDECKITTEYNKKIIPCKHFVHIPGLRYVFVCKECKNVPYHETKSMRNYFICEPYEFIRGPKHIAAALTYAACCMGFGKVENRGDGYGCSIPPRLTDAAWYQPREYGLITDGWVTIQSYGSERIFITIPSKEDKENELFVKQTDIRYKNRLIKKAICGYYTE